MAVQLARQHHLSPEVQKEFARVAGIDISKATPLEKIEAARLGLNLDYFYGVISYEELMHFDSVLDNNLASLGALQSMVLHTGGSATKTSRFSLVASYCSTEELSNHVFQMDQSEVNRGDHEYLDGFSFRYYIRLQIEYLLAKYGIEYEPQDVEDSVNEFRLHDAFSKCFSSYCHLTKRQRDEKKVNEMLDFSTSMESDHEHLKVMTCLNKLCLQTLVTNIESGSKNTIVTCSENAKELFDVFDGDERYLLSVEETELVSEILNLVHAEIIRKRRHVGYYTTTNGEMDDVLTQLNRASPTIRRLCEAQDINVESISNDFISARAGMTEWSAEQIAQHNAEVRERSSQRGETTGRMLSEASKAVKKGNTTGVPKHSLDVYANMCQGVSEAAAKMKAGDPKYTKWAETLKGNNEKRSDESDKKIERTLKGLYDSGKLKLIRSGENIGMLICCEKVFDKKLLISLIKCHDRKYPDVVNAAYKLFDINVSHIEGARQKIKEAKNLMKGLDSKAKWLKSEA